ncbi:hypothetical protein RchiOBHm_Chr6g0252901 [Rosa chinensis]|uniref:Uncharacterized protein n=1 Tax=Rosa chinensis TaxID=74649 RepID=A0A2P6PL94_ROSCH|nr:hypothetical protein RchiOBHm_Chr6g0252901 [Rosa chinensis]
MYSQNWCEDRKKYNLVLNYHAYCGTMKFERSYWHGPLPFHIVVRNHKIIILKV